MQKIMFDGGERRHVRLRIHAAGDAPFRIKTARYELESVSQVIDSGDCEIDEHVIDAYIIVPDVRTRYTFRIIYEINDETLKEKLELVVV